MTHGGKAGEAARKVDSPDTCGSGTSWGSLFSNVWGNAIEKGRRWLEGTNQKAQYHKLIALISKRAWRLSVDVSGLVSLLQSQLNSCAHRHAFKLNLTFL